MGIEDGYDPTKKDEGTVGIEKTTEPEADLAQREEVEAPPEEQREREASISEEDQVILEKIDYAETLGEKFLHYMDEIKSEILNRPSQERKLREKESARRSREGAEPVMKPASVEHVQGQMGSSFRTTGKRR